MSVQYVIAVYEFGTSQPGEISLAPGDVVKVQGQVDENWLSGTLLRGGSGSFPVNFVQPLVLPTSQLQPGQQLFVATKVFDTKMQGDLNFNRGDVVLGMEQVDANWWLGSFAGQTGIFPITHVEPLQLLPSGDQQQNHQPTSAPSGGENVQPATAPSGELALARANMDLTAQLHDELGFTVGDLVHITEVLDDDFAIGKCGGKTGSFPLSFVDIIEGDLNLGKKDTGKSERRSSKFGWWKDEKPDNNNAFKDQSMKQDDASVYSQQPSIPDPHPLTNHVPHVNDTVHSKNAYNDALSNNTAPSDGYISHRTHRRNNSYSLANTRSYDSEVTPYGKTLFPFIAENENELTFFDNEIINLICHVDEQWMEGEIDGKCGIFPTSYVEIIVDCPQADDLEPNDLDPPSSAEVMEEVPSASDELFTDVYGRVLYDFQATTEFDLNLTEGDTVTIMRQADEHWFQAKHDDGRMGMVPISYIELITAEPPMVPATNTETQAASTPEGPPLPVTDTQKEIPTVNKENTEKLEADVKISASKTPSEKQQVKVEKPAVKPKPQLKPKPNLKTKPSSSKPSPVQRSDSVPDTETKSAESANLVTTTTSANTNSPTHKAQAVTQRSQTVPEDQIRKLTKSPTIADQDKSVKPESPRPRTPVPESAERRVGLSRQESSSPKPRGLAPPGRPARGPTLNKCPSSETSLDDLIQSELKQVKAEVCQDKAGSGGEDSKPSKPTMITMPAVKQQGKKLTLNELASAQKLAQINTAAGGGGGHVVGQSMFYSAETSSGSPQTKVSPVRPPLPSPTKTVHFPVTFSDDDEETKVTSNKRPPPPRPSGPRPPPVPPRTPLVPTAVASTPAKPVPRRKAPPRPTGNPVKIPGTQDKELLMDFSPDEIGPEPGG